MEQLFLDTVIASWKQIIHRLDRQFTSLNDEQLQRQVAPGKNRLFYLLGHLTVMHDRTLPLLDISKPLYPELADAYLINPDRTLPDPLSAADLKNAWYEVNSRITSAAERYSVEEWLTKHSALSDEDFSKNPLRNRLAVFLNRTSHAAYHAGQARLSR